MPPPPPGDRPPGHVTCGACWEANSPSPSRWQQTSVKIWPCPKLRLRAVTSNWGLEIMISTPVDKPMPPVLPVPGTQHSGRCFQEDWQSLTLNHNKPWKPRTCGFKTRSKTVIAANMSTVWQYKERLYSKQSKSCNILPNNAVNYCSFSYFWSFQQQ